jgi:hypothetical protein
MPVSLASKPTGAKVTISDSSGTIVFTGSTPCVANLKRKKGNYSPATYTANFALKGWYSKEIQISSNMKDGDLWIVSSVTVLPLLSRLLFEPVANNTFVLPETVNVNLRKAE